MRKAGRKKKESQERVWKSDRLTDKVKLERKRWKYKQKRIAPK